MKLLLDSHLLLWSIDSPDLLSSRARAVIVDEKNELYVSVVSMREIAIKAGAGKLRIPGAPNFLETHLEELGVRSYLPVTLSHVRQVSKLPAVHKDPFDRMLLAQAITERLSLVSKDAHFHKYPVEVIW